MAKGRPKVGCEPQGGKTVRVARMPTDDETIVWGFSVVDLEGQWGWKHVKGQVWWNNIFPKLQNFETMTWAAIMGSSGGRTRGTNNHSVLVSELSAAAKARLQEIQQDDVVELFSLRLTATTRVYGIRDRRALKLLWYDNHHKAGDPQSVYPLDSRG